MEPHAGIGPYELVAPLGRGGMGVVVRGVHRQTGGEVAIKVIAGGDREWAAEHCRREVQTHAGLHHLHIVHLYDFDTLPADLELPDGSEASAGSPYVVMELAERGTLLAQRERWSWGQLRPVVAQVLEGLAYAHARGVIHRDLKPENLLVFAPRSDGASEGGSPPRIKLADFGVAHALQRAHRRDTQSLELITGTPYYMPPEQFAGRWRAFGPWTDLYALGCIVWELLAGRPPFQAPHALALAMQHRREERPRLPADAAAPEALDRWLRRAMAVEPEARFQRAADAARALPDVPPGAYHGAPYHAESERQREAAGLDGPGFATTLEEAATTLGETWRGAMDGDRIFDEPVDAPTLPIFVDGPGGELPDAASEHDVARDARATVEPYEQWGRALREILEHTREALQRDWRREGPGATDDGLGGAGLGLFGLREVPFVGREAERDRLWEGLVAAGLSGSARLICVLGAAGVGKTRLVDWIARRAHELGMVSIFHASHTPGGSGPAEGLSGMVRRVTHTWKLERGELYAYLRGQMPALSADEPDASLEMDARALTELMAPTGASGERGPTYQFSSPEHIYSLLVRLLRRYSRGRLPLLWVDDLQWAEEAWGFARHCLERGAADNGILVVVTARSEMLADRGELHTRLTRLVEHRRGRRIELAPLGAAEHRALVERMLPLAPGLLDEVAARTEGNPMFAAQLLAHWVERRELVRRGARFEHRDDAAGAIPDDIHGLWMDRLSRVLGVLGDELRPRCGRALEIAAFLGRELDEHEWRMTCELCGVEPPEALLGALCARGMAQMREDGGWSFAHGLLLESLRARARRAGRERGHHRSCAELLERLYPDVPARTAARRAAHWRAAGSPERAVEPLGTEGARLCDLGDYARWERVLVEQRAVLDEIGCPPTDRRRLEHDIERARCDLLLGTPPAEVLASLADLELDEVPLLRSAARRIAAMCHQLQGQFDRARELALGALTASREHGAPGPQIRALLRLGEIDNFSGRLQGAEASYARVLAIAAETAEHEKAALSAERGIAWLAVARGEPERAGRLLEDVRERAHRGGYRAIEAAAINGLGELARFGGRADEARRLYRRYRALGEEMGLREAGAIARLNEAMVELLAGRFDEAERLLERSRQMLSEAGVAALDGTFRCCRVVLAAGRQHWEPVDAYLEAHDEQWPADTRLEKDHPWLLEMAASHCDASSERARRLRALSARLRQKLGIE